MKHRDKTSPCCSVCGCQHFDVRLTDTEIPSDIFKPVFTCLNCDHIWNCGKTGGRYMKAAKGIIP